MITGEQLRVLRHAIGAIPVRTHGQWRVRAAALTHVMNAERADLDAPCSGGCSDPDAHAEGAHDV